MYQERRPMANNVLSWSYKQPIKNSSVKFVLTIMADCASDEGYCYPSISYIKQCTSLDRKTIINAVAKLEEMGIISDTGSRKGRTGQIKIYQIDTTWTVSKESRKRNSTENGTVPFFPVKESQKRDTEPSLEPLLFINKGFELPPEISKELWVAFLEMRKRQKKPPTVFAQKLLIKKLLEFIAHGHDPTQIIEKTIENGWLSFFEPTTPKRNHDQHPRSQPQPAKFNPASAAIEFARSLEENSASWSG